MSTGSSLGRGARITLIMLLVVAVLVLGVVIAVLVPILTHSSAGGSGQSVPTEYVSESSATGADGRTRELRVESPSGGPADLSALVPGEALTVTGSGFDAGIGIYISICEIPESADVKPGPCLGGIPAGAEAGEASGKVLTSAWITDDWAWRAFATQGYDDPETGSFTVTLTVPDASSNGIDCRKTRCAIATRADHTAGSDRAQDMLLPVRFAD